MPNTTTSTHKTSIDRPFNPGRRHRTDFARQATIDAFGWHFARALDQADFVDRFPGEMLKPSPEARFR